MAKQVQATKTVKAQRKSTGRERPADVQAVICRRTLRLLKALEPEA